MSQLKQLIISLNFPQSKEQLSVKKYRELAVKNEISKFFIFSQKKLFDEKFSKITIKLSKEFSSSRKPAKSEMLRSRHIRNFKIQRRGRQRERQKHTRFN